MANVTTNTTISTPEPIFDYPKPYFEQSSILAVLYCLLIVFMLLAAVAVPLAIRQLRAQSHASGEGALEEGASGEDTSQKDATVLSQKGVDFWFTARNSQPWYTVALSMTATGAGAWLLYTPAEAAYLGGWWALLGYCVAISLGPLFMAIYGPKMRVQCADGANITDWVYDRFGLVPCIWVSVIFVYYMGIYMTGQLKTMGDMVMKYTGSDGPLCPGPFCGDHTAPAHGILPVAVFTMIYTSIGGLPASIMTDQIQTVAILIIVIILSIFAFAHVDFTADAYSNTASVWTDRGVEMGFSLCFAVFGAEVFNLAFWQRVFMAKDDRALRLGFGVGTALLATLTFLFGLMGILLKAQAETHAKPIHVPAFLIFEINQMKAASDTVRMLLFILATCMITSSVDSFQIGISSVISRLMAKYNVSWMRTLIFGVALTALVNVPAVAFAQFAATDINETFDGFAVKLTDLFSMADIVTITVVVPVFSGLWEFATPSGCILGMFSGMATVIVWGWMEFGTFIAGLEMITMMCFGNTVLPDETDASGAPYPKCGFYAKRAPMIFPTIVFVTFVVTMGVSWMVRVGDGVRADKTSTCRE